MPRIVAAEAAPPRGSSGSLATSAISNSATEATPLAGIHASPYALGLPRVQSECQTLVLDGTGGADRFCGSCRPRHIAWREEHLRRVRRTRSLFVPRFDCIEVRLANYGHHRSLHLSTCAKPTPKVARLFPKWCSGRVDYSAGPAEMSSKDQTRSLSYRMTPSMRPTSSSSSFASDRFGT